MPPFRAAMTVAGTTSSWVQNGWPVCSIGESPRLSQPLAGREPGTAGPGAAGRERGGQARARPTAQAPAPQGADPGRLRRRNARVPHLADHGAPAAALFRRHDHRDSELCDVPLLRFDEVRRKTTERRHPARWRNLLGEGWAVSVRLCDLVQPSGG
jgi:hypothetical protein